MPPRRAAAVAAAVRRSVFRPSVLLALAGLVCSAAFAPSLRRVLPDLAERDAYRLRAADIVITEPPHWVPHDLVEEAVRRAGLPVDGMSLLDESLARKLYDAFNSHPWVETVGRVWKAGPRRVEAELVYRRPVAMVDVKTGMYPIDAQGVLLPPADFSPADARRYPLIRNVGSTPQGPAGSAWGDVTVAAAARLASVLSRSPDGELPHWKRLGLASIQVARPPRADATLEDVTFELVTRGGSRILWGRLPGSQHPGELSTQQKIGRLEKYQRDFGDFDRPHGPYEIDIRHWQEISRRPLAERAAALRR